MNTNAGWTRDCGAKAEQRNLNMLRPTAPIQNKCGVEQPARGEEALKSAERDSRANGL